MSGSKEEVLIQGQLQGKIAGMSRSKDWSLYYLEVTPKYVHIFEGHEDPRAARKHLRRLEINSSDTVVGEHLKFTLRRADGNYTFKCDSDYTKQKWIAALKSRIDKRNMDRIPDVRRYDSPWKDVHLRGDNPKGQKSTTLPSTGRYKAGQSAVHQPLPHVPGRGGSDSGSNSPNDSGTGSVNIRFSKMSSMSEDSGLGVSDNGQVCTDRQHHSGGDTHRRPPINTKDKNKPSSDSGMFEVREELDNYEWFWGEMNRPDSEARMNEEGEIGNFAIRVNANGHFVMTFWRTDGIHHHRIIHQMGIYRFERTAVKAEGNSLVDLLDNYMKKCTDKKIIPIGGVLHLVYDEAWNPPDIDMDQLQAKLMAYNSRKDRRRHLQNVLQPAPAAAQAQQQQPPQNPRKKAEKGESYTIVSPTSEVREDEFTQTLPQQPGLQQMSKEKLFKVELESSLKQAAGKKKALQPVKEKPSSSRVPQASVEPPNRPGAVVDKRHSPLPPTPGKELLAQTSGGDGPPPKGALRPTPAPRRPGAAAKAPPPVRPSAPSTGQQHSTSLSPPPQEQAVGGMRAAGGRRAGKKSPAPPPPKPGTQGTDDVPESDPGGQEIYQNTEFGDTSGDSELYANVPLSQQEGRSRKKKKGQNGLESHATQPYQNMGYGDDQGGGGEAYQNVQYHARGNRQKQ